MLAMGCNRCEEEKSEWGVPYKDVACCLRHSYSRRWEKRPGRSLVDLQTLQPREGFKDDLI